jgi:mono/diheme cytochrome c family protein
MISAFVTVLLAACGTPTPPPAPPPKPAAPPPAPPPAPVDITTLPPDQQKAELIKQGEKVFKTGGKGGLACITCHQENGMGTPGSFPPLVGSKDWMGDCTHHAGLVVHGLQGEIEVAGAKYNNVMTPQGTLLTDLEIAAAITYERNSWGNDYGVCLPADVVAARAAPAPTGPMAPEKGAKGEKAKGGKAKAQ